MKTQQKLMSVSVGDDTTEHLETELKAGYPWSGLVLQPAIAVFQRFRASLWFC